MNAQFDELSSALRYTEQRWHRTPSAHFPSRKLDQNFERTPRRATLQSSLRTTAAPRFHIDPFLIPVSNRSVYRTTPSVRALHKLPAPRRHHTWHAVLAATGSRLARPTGISILYFVCPYEVHQNKG
jgi:hypothetical protein